MMSKVNYKHIMFNIHALIFATILLTVNFASASILNVCQSGCTYSKPSQALSAAVDGDVIQVSAGTYNDCMYITKNNITVKGVNGRPAMTGAVCGQKGIIVTAGQNLTIQNIELYGASNGSNYAGIRHDAAGFNLTLDGVYIHDNDDGILASSTGDTILIKNSVFERNGMNDSSGYAHNLYINRAANFTFQDSSSLRAKLGGHEIKSRALNTTIIRSTIATLDGEDSRAVDISDGGKVAISDSVLEKGPNSQNNEFIAYAPESLNSGANSFSLTNNKIIADRGNGPVVLLYQSPTSVTVTGNIIVGPATALSSGNPPGNTIYATRAAAGYQAFPWLPSPGGTTPPPTGQHSITYSAGQLNLTGGQSISLIDARLIYQTDGNLVMSNNSNVLLWSSQTNLGPNVCTGTACRAVFQNDGNFVLYKGSSAYWHTSTFSRGVTLRISDTAPHLVVMNSSGTVIWSSGSSTPPPTNSSVITYNAGQLNLISGQKVVLAQGHLDYQTDGNLVFYNNSNVALWSSQTFLGANNCPSNICRAVFQADGNFVLYKGGTAYWHTSTYRRGVTLRISDTAPYLQIKDSAGTVIWNSN